MTEEVLIFDAQTSHAGQWTWGQSAFYVGGRDILDPYDSIVLPTPTVID
jgi:hypothetical protein